MANHEDHSFCPVYEAINVLQEKWTLHIIRSLLDSPKGFNELSRAVGGCNPATLAQRVEAGLLPADAVLTALEVAEHRVALVRDAVHGVERRHPGSVQVRQGDGRELGGDLPGAFDRVLVDAPCTGLGALRRRPEARWRRTPADLAALRPLQHALLGSALEAVRPGGVVAYVTCSPHPAETRLLVSDVLRRRDDVERLDARDLLPGVPDLGAGPDVQLWPHLHGTDAMYLALLRRR